MTVMVAEQINHYQNRASLALDQRLPAADLHPSDLHRAMRYAVLGGGKRIRPVLVYATGVAGCAPPDALGAPARAGEGTLPYSVMKDVLPAMDRNDLRHGQPTCHKAFGEALAILAGDALQAQAFQVLSQDSTLVVDSVIRVKMLGVLAQAAGSRGMVGGQAIDLAAVGRELSLAEIENMHIHKTGALIRASVLLGAFSQPAIDPAVLDRLDRYAKCIGLAFQIRDDILDVVGDTATLGKPQGSDRVLDKPTYPALLGLEGAREHARALYEEALASLEPLGPETDPLRWIAGYIVERAY